jgi:decaprenylphospho-beta-D-ribofuranose 2-oxidase
VVSIDARAASVTAQAGCTLAQLMDALAPHGLTLPVLPGTRYVTLGGAIASDIHGKNHHRDGALARHVSALRLWTPARGVVEVSPQSDPELFFATFGGMGLTGVVLEATVRTVRLGGARVSVDTDRTRSLRETLEVMAARDGSHRFSVAWLDLLAPPRRVGRAIVTHADPLDGIAGGEDSHAGSRARARPLASEPRVRVPGGFPGALLHPTAVRALNWMRWRSAPRRARGREQALAKYFFPLDGVGSWNRAYGSAGFVQYQLVVPDAEAAVLTRAVELLRDGDLPVYLAVCKRMGAPSGGPLSFPIAGWTLAIDLPAGLPGLSRALDDLDEMVAAAGGRVYLSKDARMRPEALRAMYPQLDRFLECRARVDPAEVLRSDLARRVGLCAGGR